MKRSFELSHHRRANVWLDEAPPAEFTASSVVTRLVKPKVAVKAARKVAGIELCLPRGPRASYALLGVELGESNVDGLEVTVSVNRVGCVYQQSIALKPDEINVGLLEERHEVRETNFAMLVLGIWTRPKMGTERRAGCRETCTSGSPSHASFRYSVASKRRRSSVMRPFSTRKNSAKRCVPAGLVRSQS